MTATNIFYNFVGFRYSPPFYTASSGFSSSSTSLEWSSDDFCWVHYIVLQAAYIYILRFLQWKRLATLLYVFLRESRQSARMDDGFSQGQVFGFLRLIFVRGSIGLGGGVRGRKWDSPRLIIALHYTFSYFPPILILKLFLQTEKESVEMPKVRRRYSFLDDMFQLFHGATLYTGALNVIGSYILSRIPVACGYMGQVSSVVGVVSRLFFFFFLARNCILDPCRKKIGGATKGQ